MQSGYENTTGSNNIYIGPLAGYNTATTSAQPITGSGNIIIGSVQNMIPNPNSSNQLNIGNLIFGTNLAGGSTVSTGNVGIGTTTPTALLDLYAAAPTIRLDGTGSGVATYAFGNINGTKIGSITESLLNGDMFISPFSASNAITIKNTSGNVGIGATATGPVSRLSVGGNGSSGYETTITRETTPSFSGNLYLVDPSTSGTQSAVVFQQDGSAVGSITTTDSATAYNTSSDRRLKENIATTTLGLATLMQLPVRDFDFIKDPTHATTTGFIAQELYPIFPAAVTTNGDNGTVSLGATSTPWQVDYGRITPLIVQAVQDIANITSTFQQNLIAWLGNASNGIHDLYATVIHASEGHFSNEVCVGKSSGGEVCVTGDQLAALLSAAGSSQTTESVSQSGTSNSSSTLPESVSSSTPPQIQINGSNPAIIQVGDTYNDLGATITGPQADLNLGITTYVNGAPMNPIQLDTSAAATDTIDYVATDQSGLTATSTRTVLIEASPSIIPTDSAGQGSNSAATTTEASSTP